MRRSSSPFRPLLTSTAVLCLTVATLVPTTECAALDPPPFRFIVPHTTGTYSPEDGAGSVTVDLRIGENQPVGSGTPTEGFAMGIGHDRALITPRSVLPLGPIAQMNGGAGPEFFGPNLHDDGVTLGVIYAFAIAVRVSFAVEQPAIRVVYDTVPATLTGNESGATTALLWSDLIGSPEIENIVVVLGQSLSVEKIDGVVELLPATTTPFVRGDCNEDGSPNLADAVWLLNYLFANGPSRDCLAACDTNDDTTVGLVDAILLLQYWMSGGPPPASPYPTCGTDDSGAPCPTYACP